MQHSLAQTKNGVKQSVSRRAAKGSSVMGARIIELAAFRAKRSRKRGPAAHDIEGQRVQSLPFLDRRIRQALRPHHLRPGRLSGAARRQLRAGAPRAGRPAPDSLDRPRAQRGPSLNLAEIRQRGAELGADEVHVHLLAETRQAQPARRVRPARRARSRPAFAASPGQHRQLIQPPPHQSERAPERRVR